MARSTATVVLETHVVARGLWCARCMLPSAVRVWVAARFDPTRTFGRWSTCRDCLRTVREP